MTPESNQRDPHFGQRASELLAELKQLIPQVEQCAGRVDEINALAEHRRQLEESAWRGVSQESVELQKRAWALDKEIRRACQPLEETSRAVCQFVQRVTDALKSLPAHDALRQEIEPLRVYRDAVLFARVSLSKAAPDWRRIEDLLRGVRPVRGKRGRPSPIPDERKERALAAKRAGASNKQVAQILYDVKTPTSAQKRGASAILRHYERSKAARSQSPELLRTAQ